jgi:hypothetical protein
VRLIHEENHALTDCTEKGKAATVSCNTSSVLEVDANDCVILALSTISGQVPTLAHPKSSLLFFQKKIEKSPTTLHTRLSFIPSWGKQNSARASIRGASFRIARGGRV